MVKQVAQAAGRADALFIPDGAEGVVDVLQALANGGVNLRQFTVLGTGLWADDPRITANHLLEGAWFAAPEPTGYRGFADRYRARYHQDPVRQATLAYDAVALVAALVKTQGQQRFADRHAHQSVRLHRDRRGVPLPQRRLQPARPRGDEGHVVRRPGGRARAALLQRLRDLGAWSRKVADFSDEIMRKRRVGPDGACCAPGVECRDIAAGVELIDATGVEAAPDTRPVR